MRPEVSFRHKDSPADWTCAGCHKVVKVGSPLLNPLLPGGEEFCAACVAMMAEALKAAALERKELPR